MKNSNFTKKELEIIFTNNYDCFADCGDGNCHALTKKSCKGCRFYTPRCQVKDNPFYKYSWLNEDKIHEIIKRNFITKDQIMEQKDEEENYKFSYKKKESD